MSKEIDEREEAAVRYLEEDEKHFTDYQKACEEESENGSRDKREQWDDLMDAYDGIAPTCDKENWQSDFVSDKPFVTVQHAKSIIQKSLMSGSFRFYNMQPKRQYTTAAFVQMMLEFGRVVFDTLHSPTGSNFITNFTDACEMAFTVGTSSEMIPTWHNGKIKWELAPPWQIYRDPYATPRDPQSGNYWIREAWLDKWELLQLADQGIFISVEEAMKSAQPADATDKNKEESTRGTTNLYKRNDFIDSFRVMDFYGRIVSPTGELLLDRGRFTTCGDRVIRPPKKVPYPTLRWPGVSFSPLPHMLRYEGTSIIQGVLSLWDLFNNIMNLHMDSLNYQLNNIWERRPDLLIDPDRDDMYPGAIIDTKSNAGDAPVHRPLLVKHTTPDALANMQYLDTMWDSGSLTPNTVTGLPGYRQEVTKSEYEGAQGQAMGVFHSMAKELEIGAEHALWAAYEIAMMNITRDSDLINSPELPEEVRNQVFASRQSLIKYADLDVTGISNMANRAEAVAKLNDAMLKMQDPILARYHIPHNLLKAYYEVIDLSQYDPIVNSDEAKKIDEQVKQKLATQDILTRQSNNKQNLDK